MNTRKSTDDLRFGAFSDHDAQVDVNKRKPIQKIGEYPFDTETLNR